MPEQEAPAAREIEKLFRLMVKYGASDLHLKVGSPPVLRISGSLRNLELPPLSAPQVKKLIYEILNEHQQKVLEDVGDVDLAYAVDDTLRLRINAFHQRGALSLAARLVNAEIPSFHDLHLPPETMERIASFDQGFVIITGPTGSGKSTTLASLIEYINNTRRCHIVTIEDPIEYTYTDRRAIINQREVGIDVQSFREALKYVVRQDPDVILLGEMRDTETVQAGLAASETGHLVFGTLHASTVSQAFTRLLEFFEAGRQQAIRTSLRFNLRGIIAQKLLAGCKPEAPRVPALEIMLVNAPIAKMIEEANDVKILDVIKSAREEGMLDFNRSMYELIQNEYITKEVGKQAATNPQALEAMLQGVFQRESALS
ncbi:PilT/PilU family type 4a pilus ATPase [bacterium]|nr:PilT/PilU family type 4a pilus ATPase [bacterium]